MQHTCLEIRLRQFDIHCIRPSTHHLSFLLQIVKVLLLGFAYDLHLRADCLLVRCELGERGWESGFDIPEVESVSCSDG